MGELSKSWWTVGILGSQGHAEILRNELAEKLAKGAATEAVILPKDTRIVTMREADIIA